MKNSLSKRKYGLCKQIWEKSHDESCTFTISSSSNAPFVWNQRAKRFLAVLAHSFKFCIKILIWFEMKIIAKLASLQKKQAVLQREYAVESARRQFNSQFSLWWPDPSLGFLGKRERDGNLVRAKMSWQCLGDHFYDTREWLLSYFISSKACLPTPCLLHLVIFWVCCLNAFLSFWHIFCIWSHGKSSVN